MLCYNSNEKIKVAQISQSLLNGALAIEIVKNSFSESKKNSDRFRKRWMFLSKNIFPLDFAKYLSYSEV